MMHIIEKRNWYYVLSLIIILPGLVSLALFGLNPSIDFTGGSRITLLFPQTVSNQTKQKVSMILDDQKIRVATIQQGGKELFIKSEPIDEKENTLLMQRVQKELGDVKQEEFATVGPTVGSEITANAVKAMVISSLLIVLYTAWSFKEVPKPASSWRFGVCAVVALVHDVLVLVGVFSILGHFFHVEVDSLFVTAVLTVIGFSVHDTIVVFDRVRENLHRVSGHPFARIVNDSILQTISRSLNTSLTAMLVLITLLLFGGESIKWFVVALLIGIGSGTYSSIFNAAQLLVTWEEWDKKRVKK